MTGMASQLSKGEPFAWEQLYDATADQLFHYLSVLAGDQDAAAEILQETFVRLFRRRERLDSVNDLQAYVFTVARNEANRVLRNTKAANGDAMLAEFACWDLNRSRQEDIELVQFALRELSRGEHEVVCLKVYSGFTFAQIASILELPQGTCASRYRRALDKLKSRIQEQTQ